MMMPEFTLLQKAPAWGIALVLFVLIVIGHSLGHWFRVRAIARDPENEKVEIGPITNTMLALLGLLLAFSFGMSNSRYDNRRQIIIEEANNIGTALLRADLYPDSVRNLMRKNFKAYIIERVSYHTSGTDWEAAYSYYQKADSISSVLWHIATHYAKETNDIMRTAQMVPALNAMIDITTTRIAAGLATIPDSILYFLFSMCICASFLLGYDNRKKVDGIVVAAFAVLLSITVFTIVDLDKSRAGFIKTDQSNERIQDLLKMFE